MPKVVWGKLRSTLATLPIGSEVPLLPHSFGLMRGRSS